MSGSADTQRIDWLIIRKVHVQWDETEEVWHVYDECGDWIGSHATWRGAIDTVMDNDPRPPT